MIPAELRVVLECMRKANAAIDTLQTHEFIVSADERHSLLSSARIELSCAAGKISEHLAAVGSDRALTVVDGGAA